LNGPFRSFYGPHRAVTIDSNHKTVTKVPGAVKKINVSRMNQVETSIRKNSLSHFHPRVNKICRAQRKYYTTSRYPGKADKCWIGKPPRWQTERCRTIISGARDAVYRGNFQIDLGARSDREALIIKLTATRLASRTKPDLMIDGKIAE
jgi:hypothetical protein